MEDFEKAFHYSLLLLKYRPRSKGEIEDRLKGKRFSSIVITEVLNRLQDYNYINDAEFTLFFISSCLARGWGRRRIEFRLEKLKIPRSLQEKFLRDEDFGDQLRQLISKKLEFYRGKKNIYQRLVRFLAGRGFDYDEIFSELQNVDIKKFEKMVSDENR